MVNVPTFENVPNFGSASAKTQPEPSTYVGGYIPGQVFPAEHENWFMAALTTNGNTQQTAITSVVSELDTILAAAGITPASGLVNQVHTALNALYATLNLTNASHGRTVLTSGTSYTVPSGVYGIWVTTIGGGGGGGAGGDASGTTPNRSAGRGGDGGGGGGVNKSYVTCTPGQVIAYTIGTGGSGGAPPNPTPTGGDGGSTSFTGAITSIGGKGGVYGNITSVDSAIGGGGNCGMGGSGVAGGIGGYEGTAFRSGGLGGAGGGAGGPGGRIITTGPGFPGGDAVGFGGGGGGGGGTSAIGGSPSASGGNGGNGAVIIEY